MAMVVVLFRSREDKAELGTAALERLADLGVTSVTLLRDGAIAGLVLEGWAFDPARANEATCAVAGACDPMWTLHQLAQTVVTSRPSQMEEMT